MAEKHLLKPDVKTNDKQKSHANDPLILKRTKEAQAFLQKADLPERLEQRIKKALA